MSKSSRAWFQRQLTAGEQRGTIGKVDPFTGAITYTTPDGMYWWVTLESSTLITAVNSITGYNRTDVIVKPLDDGTWVVDRLQTAKVWQVFGNAISSLLTPPHTHHSNGPTPDTTQTRMILDGLVQTRSGDPALTLYVNNFKYKTTVGADALFAGGTIDMTSYIPVSAGTKAPIKVGFDPVAATLVAAAGTAVSVVSPIGDADVALIPFTGYIPLTAVVLTNGQVTAPVESDFIDCGIIRQNPNVSGGVSPLTTKGDVFTYSTTNARLPVAIDNSALITDSTQTTGLRWQLPLWGAAYNYTFATSDGYAIGFGLSSDQRAWSRKLEPAISAGSGFESSLVKSPALVVANGLIYCYYDGYDGSVYKIGLAVSYDGGASFAKSASNPILTTGQSWENSGGANQVAFAAVLYDVTESSSSKRWKMWYAGGAGPGSGGIGYAYSADGVSWTKYASNPVMTPASGWESTYIIPGAVVKLGSLYYLFYNGYNGSGTWQAGCVTFIDPQGTYTENANNPLLLPDGLTTTITGNVSVNDTTIAVTDATVFPIGSGVWVYDGTNHYLSYVTQRTDSTHVVLADPAPVAVGASGGNVRSAAYNSVNIHSAWYDGGWNFGLVGFQPGFDASYVKEAALLGYADNSLTSVAFDYSAGLILRMTLAQTDNNGHNSSLENPSIAPLFDTERRFLAGEGNYQTVQVGGSAQTQRAALDLIAGTNITLTPADDDAGNRTKVTINSSGGGGGGWTQCCRVYNSGDLTIPNSTLTALTFDTEVYDTDTMHSTISNTERITFTTAGYYYVHGQVDWDVPAGSLNLQLQIRVNGSAVPALVSHTANDTSSYQRMEISTDYQFSAADYVELLVSQNSGGNLAVKHQADNHSPAFMTHRFA